MATDVDPVLNDHIDLSGKTALITGASKGIGEAAARRLHAANANVVLLARSESVLKQVTQSLGNNALGVACDVSKYEAVKSAFMQGTERFGSVDILVNNAGLIDPVTKIADADVGAWDHVVDVNLKGVFYCLRQAIPLMERDGGTIINISSGAATNALEGWSHYCATKAAVLSLTRSVHLEYADAGIRCGGLSPGTVATDMQKTIKSSGVNPVSELDWSVHIPPQWVAETILWLCSESARSYDGSDFSLKNDAGRQAVGLPLA